MRRPLQMGAVAAAVAAAGRFIRAFVAARRRIAPEARQIPGSIEICQRFGPGENRLFGRREMVFLAPDNERVQLYLCNTCFACLVEMHGHTVGALIDLGRPEFDQHRQSVIQATIGHHRMGIAEMRKELRLILFMSER